VSDLPAESGEWAGMGEITAGMRWDGEKPTWDGLGKSDGWEIWEDFGHGTWRNVGNRWNGLGKLNMEN